MSQEQLAEKLNISRQAVAKWEMNAGLPDIDNIMAHSVLFDNSNIVAITSITVFMNIFLERHNRLL